MSGTTRTAMARDAGWEAFMIGLPMDCNPYTNDNQCHTEWKNGYKAAAEAAGEPIPKPHRKPGGKTRGRPPGRKNGQSGGRGAA
jgi:hypothetical protein